MLHAAAEGAQGGSLFGVAAIITALTALVGVVLSNVSARRKAADLQAAADNLAKSVVVADTKATTTATAVVHNAARLDTLTAKSEANEALQQENIRLQALILEQWKMHNEQAADWAKALAECHVRDAAHAAITDEVRNQLRITKEEVRTLTNALHGLHPNLLRRFDDPAAQAEP